MTYRFFKLMFIFSFLEKRPKRSVSLEPECHCNITSFDEFPFIEGFESYDKFEEDYDFVNESTLLDSYLYEDFNDTDVDTLLNQTIWPVNETYIYYHLVPVGENVWYFPRIDRYFSFEDEFLIYFIAFWILSILNTVLFFIGLAVLLLYLYLWIVMRFVTNKGQAKLSFKEEESQRPLYELLGIAMDKRRAEASYNNEGFTMHVDLTNNSAGDDSQSTYTALL